MVERGYQPLKACRRHAPCPPRSRRVKPKCEPAGRGRFAVAVDADHGRAAVFPPAVGHRPFPRQCAAALRQHRPLLVGRVLAVKAWWLGMLTTRTAMPSAASSLRLQGQCTSEPGGDDHRLGFFFSPSIGRLAQDVAAAATSAQIVAVASARFWRSAAAPVGLPFRRQADRPFRRCRRAPDVQAGDQAQAGGVLDRLVRRARPLRPMESCVNTWITAAASSAPPCGSRCGCSR